LLRFGLRNYLASPLYLGRGAGNAGAGGDAP
jgi:hypothetical protein